MGWWFFLHALPEELLKDVLHIQILPAESTSTETENWTSWVSGQRQQGRGNPHQPLTSDDMYP